MCTNSRGLCAFVRNPGSTVSGLVTVLFHPGEPMRGFSFDCVRLCAPLARNV